MYQSKRIGFHQELLVKKRHRFKFKNWEENKNHAPDTSEERSFFNSEVENCVLYFDTIFCVQITKDGVVLTRGEMLKCEHGLHEVLTVTKTRSEDRAGRGGGVITWSRDRLLS